MENKIISILVFIRKESNLLHLLQLIRNLYPEAYLLCQSCNSSVADFPESFNPDLVFLDKVDAKIEEFEICDKLKNNISLIDVPVIFVTSINETNEGKRKAINEGAESFISNQIGEIELEALIRNMVKIRKANFENKKEKNRLALLINEQNNEISKTHIAALNLLEDLQTEIETRKITEFALRESEDKLRVTMAEKDRFFSIIAHDLKGPINGFLALTQMMSDDLQSLSKDEIKKAILSMRNSAANLFRLLENLLQWSKIMQGNVQFSPRQIQIKPFVEDCISMIIDQAKTKKINVVVNLPEDLEVAADGNMLQSVIRNLVSNALKFTQIGGIVTVSAVKNENREIQVSVNDNGIGMNQELVSKLFSMNENKKRKGTAGESSTGLGLILCKEFIEKHNGKIWAESEEGVGSTFHFTLPINV